MIRRLRWKITGVTMLVAFMVLLAVFGGVYFFSQANIAQSYIHQLKQAVQTGVVDGRFPCFVAEVLPSGTVRVSCWTLCRRRWPTAAKAACCPSGICGFTGRTAC